MGEFLVCLVFVVHHHLFLNISLSLSLPLLLSSTPLSFPHLLFLLSLFSLSSSSITP